MGRKVLDVFLSSTAEDLKPFRAEVHKRLMSKGIFHCVRQEDFGAQDARAVEYCRKQSETADIFVGLIGLRRGWEPKGDKAKRSITEMEHDWARKAGVRRYLWVAPHDFPVAGHIRESDALHARQQALRTKVMANGERIVSQAGFGSPELLAADVVDRLLIEVVTSDLIRELRPDLSGQGGSPAEEQRPAIAAAVEKLAEDKDVDLLALAKNPIGADLAELTAKLRTRAEKLAAESAEYWRHIGALAFLHDTQNAIAAFEKAVAFDPGNPEAWHYLGELQYRLGNFAAAEQSFVVLKNFGEESVRSRGCMRLAWIYLARGDLLNAKKITKEALRLAEHAQWTEGTARAYGLLGVIHRERGELKQAAEMQQRALAIYEALGSKWGMALVYRNLGIIYRKRGNLDRAEDMQRRSLKLYELLGGRQGMAASYGLLGTIYHLRGDLDQAETMQLKSLALNRALGYKEGIAITYGELAKIDRARNECHRMCEYAREARNLWQEMGLQDKAAEADQWLRDNGCDTP
jgi:tetratricopeptide (TPR) repeat protein